MEKRITISHILEFAPDSITYLEFVHNTTPLQLALNRLQAFFGITTETKQLVIQHTLTPENLMSHDKITFDIREQKDISIIQEFILTNEDKLNSAIKCYIYNSPEPEITINFDITLKNIKNEEISHSYEIRGEKNIILASQRKKMAKQHNKRFNGYNPNGYILDIQLKKGINNDN